MTDRNNDPASSADSAATDRGAPPRMPGWVKALLVVVAALILLVIIVKVTGLGGSDHGPGRHTGTGAIAEVLVGRG